MGPRAVKMGYMRIFPLAVAFLVAASPAQAGAGAITATRVERFEVAFLYKANRAYEEYVAVATRTTDPTSGDVLGVWVRAGIRPCSLDPEGALTCRGDLAEQEVVRFEASEDMLDGTLVFRSPRGRTSRIVLRGDDPYAASGRSLPNECGGATFQRYEQAYNASARGTMFGRKVTTQGDADPEAESMSRHLEIKGCA